MKALIVKDLLFIKSSWKNLLVLFIGSLLISIALGNYLLAIVCVPVWLLASGINTFQTDEFYNTESYTLSFPLSRKKIVLSKYLFSIVMLAIATWIGLIIYALIAVIIRPGFNGLNTDMIKYLIMLELASLIVDAVFYPVIYKFGCEKSRLVLMSIIMLLLGIAAIISAYINTHNIKIDLTNFVNLIQDYGVYVISIVTVIALIISYILSINFYKKKDY